MVFEIIGFFGMGLILFAFVMNQLKKWKSTFFVYDFLNFLGGFMLVFYALMIESYPFLILNSVWTLVSLRDLILYLKKKIK
jgi:uncharacterized membrane protein YdcZ (DUF606 family)